MKIILCTFLLCITTVSVFGQSVELNGILGKSLEFPAAVKKDGFLMYGGVSIGAVTSGRFTPSRNEKYSGRVQWDSSTGFFSLSGLKMEDIGEYKVQNTDQNIAIFQLNVYTVSVFGQSVELNGILGESVKFPAAVEKGGFLMYGGVSIGESSLEPPGIGKYSGRLQWDSSTAQHFSLSGLKMEDIGEYKVQNTDQNIAVFQLNVHAVSVFGEPQELHGILGKSINFPAAVKKGGFLMYSGVTLGDVTSGSFWAPRNERFNGRVQWDSSTGFFSLSGLKLEDSGEYKVQNTDSDIKTVFQLNVYIPVSKPHVNVTRNEYRCTLLCTVDKGARATLYWYREGEKESYGSSPVESAPHLYLPLSVERSGTYTCKAKNSVSNETSDPLTVGAHCTVTDSFSTGRIVFLSVAVAALIAGVCAVCCCCNRSKPSTKYAQPQRAYSSVS